MTEMKCGETSLQPRGYREVMKTRFAVWEERSATSQMIEDESASDRQLHCADAIPSGHSTGLQPTAADLVSS